MMNANPEQSNRHKMMFRIALLSAGTYLALSLTSHAQEPLLPDNITPTLLNSLDDQDTQEANATVLLDGYGGTCTGTLIAPQIVISAGHCGFYDGRQGWEPDKWFDISDRGARAGIGIDRASLKDSIDISHINISGNRDLVLLMLERPVDRSDAVPMRVLFEQPEAARRNPQAFWAEQTFRQAGWGVTPNGSVPFIRQTGFAGDAQINCTGTWGWEAFCVRGSISGASQTTGGDSGGPLYWTNPENNTTYMIGILQGSSGGGNNFDRYHETWSEFELAWPGDQGDDSDAPWGQAIGLTQKAWIQNAIRGSACKQIQAQAYANSPTRPIYHWYSPSRGDNFVTSHLDWAGCVGDQQSGYRLSRVLGQVYTPNAPQPSGTHALYQWWNPERGDNFITTDSRWSDAKASERPQGYSFVRIEGYVLKTEPMNRGEFQTEYAPLWSWYSAQRGDNFMTSDPTWAPNGSNPNAPDYRYFRTEGYLFE